MNMTVRIFAAGMVAENNICYCKYHSFFHKYHIAATAQVIECLRDFVKNIIIYIISDREH